MFVCYICIDAGYYLYGTLWIEVVVLWIEVVVVVCLFSGAEEMFKMAGLSLWVEL